MRNEVVKIPKGLNRSSNLQILGAPCHFCIETESEEIFQKSPFFGGLHPLLVNQNYAKIYNFPEFPYIKEISKIC